MYAKLFSRITESSLMEEPLPVRYVFMMMLAIADPKGNVIGTDVAIARRLNISLTEFKQCKQVLTAPDPDSNSKEKDGRRIVESEGERGYHVVNYLVYRNLKTPDDRRAYMREYMRNHRASKQPVNTCKQGLIGVTQAEAEAKAEVNPPTPQGGTPQAAEGGDDSEEKKKRKATLAALSLRVGAIVRRRPTTAWTPKEKRALSNLYPIPENDLALIERYYSAPIDLDKDYRRRDLSTLLNNWPAEVDRANRHFGLNALSGQIAKKALPAGWADFVDWLAKKYSLSPVDFSAWKTFLTWEQAEQPMPSVRSEFREWKKQNEK